MFYVSRTPAQKRGKCHWGKECNLAQEPARSRMSVRGIGTFHKIYASIINILNMKDKTVLDLGSGLGFISLYILFEKDSPELAARGVTAVDVDYNYMNIVKKVVNTKKEFQRVRNKLNMVVKRIEFNESIDAVNIPTADIVFAPGSLLENFLACSKQKYHLSSSHGNTSDLTEQLESYVSVLSNRAVETVIVEFVSLDDPTLKWAIGRHRKGFASRKNYNRDLFESFLYRYFSDTILLDHPTPTRSIYVVTKQLPGNNKLFINKNNLEIGEQKRIFNILRDSSKLFAMPHRRESGSFILGDAKMLIGVVVDNQNKYMQQAITWLNTLRWKGGQTNIRADIMVCTLPGVPKGFQAYMASLGAVVRPVLPLGHMLPGVTPHSNKIRFFQQVEVLSGQYETIVYMDTDVLIFDDFAPYFSDGWHYRVGSRVDTHSADRSNIPMKEPLVAKFRAGRTVWYVHF